MQKNNPNIEDQAWLEMKSLLDFHMPIKRKRKPIWVSFMPWLLICIGITVAITYANHKKFNPDIANANCINNASIAGHKSINENNTPLKDIEIENKYSSDNKKFIGNNVKKQIDQHKPLNSEIKFASYEKEKFLNKDIPTSVEKIKISGKEPEILSAIQFLTNEIKLLQTENKIDLETKAISLKKLFKYENKFQRYLVSNIGYNFSALSPPYNLSFLVAKSSHTKNRIAFGLGFEILQGEFYNLENNEYDTLLHHLHVMLTGNQTGEFIDKFNQKRKSNYPIKNIYSIIMPLEFHHSITKRCLLGGGIKLQYHILNRTSFSTNLFINSSTSSNRLFINNPFQFRPMLSMEYKLAAKFDIGLKVDHTLEFNPQNNQILSSFNKDMSLLARNKINLYIHIKYRIKN